MTDRPSVDIYLDYVVFEGCRIDRPSWTSRSQWELLWRTLLARFGDDS